jgi:protein-disulfide isomerase
VSDRSRQTNTTTRRARREAQRRAARATPITPSRGRSPIVWITAAAVVAGIIFVAVLIFANGSSDSLALTPPSETTPTELADGRAIGAADAPATLEIWSDFQCPSCGLFARAAEARLIREYVADGRLRIVYRDFAFIGDESTEAAVAARAAEAQGKFWPYHDWLFANQAGENKGGFRREVLVGIAREIGLDVPAFEAALGDAALAEAVAGETTSGRAVPVRSTPTLVLGDEVIVGVPAWDELAAKVEAEIARAGGQPAP